MTDASDHKPALRARFRAQRAAIGRDERLAWTPALNQHLLSSETLRSATLVAAYFAFDAEPDIRFTLTQLHRRGVRLALPLVPERRSDPLEFHRWTPATPMRQNRFGIAEPQGTERADLSTADVVLVPLVAWDRAGGRLGMGAGWYDRTLTAADGAQRVGVGWSLQEAAALPRDDWDVSLDAVVTERGWFTCGKRHATIPDPS